MGTRLTASSRRSCIGLVVALALFAAGCTTGRDRSGGGDSAARSRQGVTDSSIKIGMFAPLSGPAAVYGKGMKSMIAYYEEINDAGGINGRKLELVVEDSKCDPTALALAAKKLINSDKVFLLHGGMCSNAVINVLPDIERSGVPFLVMAAAAAEIVDPPKANVFVPWVSQPANTAAIADYVVSYLAAKGGSRVAVVAQHDDWGSGWRKYLDRDLTAAAKREGVKVDVVADEEIAEKMTNATPQVRKVLDAHADISIVFALPQPLSVYLRDARRQGLAVPVLTGNAVEPAEELERVGDRAAVSGLITTYCFGALLDSAPMKPYRDRLARRYPKDKFDGIAVSGVIGAELIVEVLRRMGDDLTRERFIKEMEAVRDFTGPTSPDAVSFGPFDPKDPQTRSGSDRCKLSMLSPQGSAGSVVVFDSTYSGQQQALKK